MKKYCCLALYSIILPYSQVIVIFVDLNRDTIENTIQYLRLKAVGIKELIAKAQDGAALRPLAH